MKGYRTYIVNGLMLVLAVTEYFNAAPQLVTSVFGEAKGSAIVAGFAVINLALRTLTNTAPGKKE